MTYKNSCSGWKLFLGLTCPEVQENDGAFWRMTEHLLRRIAELIWLGWWLTPFFLAEMLIHSLVKSTRIVFCVSFENEKLTRFPSYLNEVAATEKTLLCVLSTRLRADFAIRFVCWRAQVFKVEETRRSTWLPQALGACLWNLHRSLSRALSAREESIPV